MKVLGSAVLYLTMTYLLLLLDADPIMGPADIILKHGGNCDLKISTLIDYHLRYYQRRGQYVFQINFTSPWPFGDDLGVSANVAVKRNGAWKPNFLQLKGDKVCSAVKKSQYGIFKLFAKQLKAPEPPTCPLPPGFVSVTYDPDISGFQEIIHVDILPYGEFRLLVNLTRKQDVVACLKYYVDVVPKKKPTKG